MRCGLGKGFEVRRWKLPRPYDTEAALNKIAGGFLEAKMFDPVVRL
jgi:hypothetical protein